MNKPSWNHLCSRAVSTRGQSLALCPLQGQLGVQPSIETQRVSLSVTAQELPSPAPVLGVPREAGPWANAWQPGGLFCSCHSLAGPRPGTLAALSPRPRPPPRARCTEADTGLLFCLERVIGLLRVCDQNRTGEWKGSNRTQRSLPEHRQGPGMCHFAGWESAPGLQTAPHPELRAGPSAPASPALPPSLLPSSSLRHQGRLPGGQASHQAESRCLTTRSVHHHPDSFAVQGRRTAGSPHPTPGVWHRQRASTLSDQTKCQHTGPRGLSAVPGVGPVPEHQGHSLRCQVHPGQWAGHGVAGRGQAGWAESSCRGHIRGLSPL